MKVKNTTQQSFAINKSVQIDVQTPDANDGYVLAGQTLDLSKSLTMTDLLESDQIRDGIYSGDLIFVVDGMDMTQDRSIEIYNSGDTEWSNTFNEDIKKRNLNIAVASGFLYIGEFRVG